MGSSLMSGAILSTFNWSENRRAGHLGARYRTGPLTVVGLVQRATVKGSTLGLDQKVATVGVGASYRLGERFTIKGQHYALSADGDGRDAGMTAVGVDYQLARPLRLMFAFARTSNDDLVRYGMSRGGHAAQQLAAATGLDPQGFSVAVRYDF
ncbi:MAG: porin [Aquimonas sp.]|nr:porin [Aquimonas sp.]